MEETGQETNNAVHNTLDWPQQVCKQKQDGNTNQFHFR